MVRGGFVTRDIISKLLTLQTLPLLHIETNIKGLLLEKGAGEKERKEAKRIEKLQRCSA